MNQSLLIAWEKGYNAIPGIMAQDVTNWSEMKMVVRELKKQEVKDTFKCIVIDTVDIAAAACEKYICSQEGIDSIGELAYGKGWTKVKQELESTFRTITQLGYALFFISHAKDKVFKRQDGTEYNQVVPTLSNSYNEIVKDMADLYAYAHQVRKEDGTVIVKLTLRSLDGSADTGCRFKYIKPEIDFTYDALVEALNDAIDKEAQVTNGKFITNDRYNNDLSTSELNYDSLMEEFSSIIKEMSQNEEKMRNFYTPRIVEITERYLGKGKKVSTATRDQVEQLSLIIFDLKELLNEQ